eukprot:m.169572 g.169572  ORF g.169572 m.169572 type:complete len:76 (+) comp14500_c0_seq3:190-417(+)
MGTISQVQCARVMHTLFEAVHRTLSNYITTQRLRERRLGCGCSNAARVLSTPCKAISVLECAAPSVRSNAACAIS